MAMTDRTIRRVVLRRPGRAAAAEPIAQGAPEAAPAEAAVAAAETVEIAPNDPLVAYFQGALGAVELANLDLDSPALTELRAAGVTLVVPLIANGELVGLLNVGRRLSDQDYSGDDRHLLETLAAQAAPAVRVGQLVREQQAETRARGRLEQELAVAQLIQQNFLPKQLPQPAGWQVAAFYRPARAVGGDFYDFIELTDGRIGLVIGDVTDKGVPAAMVMAATRSVLRASAQRLLEPGAVLARVNDNLCPDIPENMFVTCFYGVLDPATGHLRYANAGHNVPLVHSPGESSELRATGMPLGLMTGMRYEERETTLPEDACVLLYSDGLIEAHDRQREMFGTPRVVELLGRTEADSQRVIDDLLVALDGFTGTDEEQEDDITLVVVRRHGSLAPAVVLADFAVVSAPGNERDAMARVAEAVASLAITPARLERLKTATAEATMNAMEHGNGYDPDLYVQIVVSASAHAVTVRIVDHGGDREIAPAALPDINEKLDGRQSPRGWGLFLIEKMVDALHQDSDGSRHTVELVMHLEGAIDATREP
jgi:serine phosphatase RsbU (regulator of sigma subunit)/anti-sigma regulatory factor (Ser/Thr protein kinase)